MSWSRPTVTPDPDGIHAVLDFGSQRITVCHDAVGHWVHVDTWRVYSVDGILLWAPPSVRALPEYMRRR
jgi:hypothetical protein